MSNTELARIAVSPPAPLVSQEDLQLLQDTLAKGSTPAEFKLFVHVCRHKNLDPFSKQIHAIKRWDDTLKRQVMSFQVGIDGLRLIAERTKRYEGQEGPYWCGPDGKWTDVWLGKTVPSAARVGVYRRGFPKPIFAVALYTEYVQNNRENRPNSMWAKMPANQLAKCAEAAALRKAFPEELSGLYAPEEMGGQESDLEPPPIEAPPLAPSEPEKKPVDIDQYPVAVKLMWSSMVGIKGICAGFAELKRRMVETMGPGGESEYYRILRQIGGVAHANEFRRNDQKAAVREASLAMWKAIEEIEALREEPAAGEIEPDREPGDGE